MHYPDGRVIPLECRYLGERDGVHHWQVVSPPVVPAVPGMELEVDRLPARTGIHLFADPGRVR